MRALGLLVLVISVPLCLWGCPSSAHVQAPPPRHEPEPTPEPAPEPAPEPIDEGPHVREDTVAPAGPACTTTAECGAGQTCRGPRGCTSPWACGEPPDCSGELVAYCDCDGSTFHAPAGCPGRAYLHAGPCEELGPLASADELGIHAYDEPPTTEDRTCESNADCRAGEQCYGPPGCGMPWRCERLRGCAGPRGELCGCDGQSFRASLQCPGRPYVRRGACGDVAVAAITPPALADAHAAQTTSTQTAQATQQTAQRTEATQSTAAPTTTESGERICQTSRDCRRGQVCSGPPGCGMTWTCQRPAERCNPDTQVFCDCERNTFRASMNCPGQPYAHRGSCEIDRMLELSGARVR
ncbi:MAG: hypothetical protein K1X94_00645 [Sandaracinaceae bacterium]|nr:hypothetical protein [Sandaracinaceae bacterium]